MGRISFEILSEFISTLLVLQLALFRRELSPSTSQDSCCLRENVLLRFCTSSRFRKFVIVNSLGFVTLLAIVQALCSLTNQVLELHRLDEIQCTSPRCSAIQSCLLDVSVRQCLLVFKLFSYEDQSLLFLTSKLDHFFTRASWATTVILSTITLYLITSRIECVTTFAQAFQRSDQTARCALHTTFRVAR